MKTFTRCFLAGFFLLLTACGRPKPEVFAPIPAGTFTMGRTSGDIDENAPPVNVYVSEFYMARHQVTWELWNEVRAWAVENGYTDIDTGGGKGANHPVHSVNWWDVVKWCNARSEREGLDPVYRNADGTVFKTGTTAPTAHWNADGYRLPTEAEWEKAARGGVTGQRFPWGDTIDHSNANYRANGDAYSYDTSPYTTRTYHPAYNDGTMPYTSPVGSFAANGYGLYDMSGNVWEWCWDWYSASTYMKGATEPKGASSGSYRVNRGGSWNGGAWHCRSALRSGNSPSDRLNYYGFRPARSSAPARRTERFGVHQERNRPPTRSRVTGTKQTRPRSAPVLWRMPNQKPGSGPPFLGFSHEVSLVASDLD